MVPQQGYFCNNANSAILRKVWKGLKFNENLTGLEDLELARRLVQNGGRIGYIAESVVEHIHEESWARIKLRFEREAVALADIDPSLSITLTDAIFMFSRSLFSDISALNKQSFSYISSILCYRFCQYWGTFVGSRVSKRHITRMKRQYFYPQTSEITVTLGSKHENSCTSTDEST